MKCSHCGGTGIEPDVVANGDDALFALEHPNPFVAVGDAFERFWQMYGKVGPKKVARQCFERAVRRGNDPETILAGTERWVAYWRSPGAASQKWPQGFLNQDYFLDEPPAVRVEQQRRTMPGRSGIEAALAARQRGSVRQIESGEPR